MKPRTAGILGAMVGSGIVGLLMIPAMLTRDRTIAEQKLEIVRLRSAERKSDNPLAPGESGRKAGDETGRNTD